MKKQIITGLFSASLLLLASCAEDDYNHNNLSDKPITFAPAIELSDWNAASDATRGTLFTATSFPNDAVFGVSAYRYDGTTLTAATAPANFMYKTAISRTLEKWRTTEQYYWPGNDDRLDFYAYYPYDHPNVVPKSQETTGPMQLVYTVNSNPANQVDLLTASTKNCTFNNTAAVNLSFTHQLTAINLVLGANVAPGYIKSITFEHIATQGTLTVGTGWSEKNDANFALDMKAYYDSTKGYKTTDNNDNIVTGDAANITAATTTLLMIPQTFGNQNQILKVVFANEDHPDGVELTTTLTDAWVAGSTLTYQISTSDINVLKIAAITYPGTDTWGNAFCRTDYKNNEEIGLYAIDAQGNVQVDNVKLTRTNDGWVDNNGSTPLYTPGLRWFMYYPWKDVGLAHNGKKNNVVVTTADDFFADGVDAWQPNSDQHSESELIAQDLQIGTGVSTAASTYSFTMKHTMGLVHLSIPATTEVENIRYFNTSGQKATSSGTANVTPVTTLETYQPYYYATNKLRFFVVRPETDVTFSPSSTIAITDYNAWDADITANVEANKYKSYSVTNKLISREYVYRGWVYASTGSCQSFSAPVNGAYTFECWGADGGASPTTVLSGQTNAWPGIGGYTKGTISLSANDRFYVYVGGVGNRSYYALGGENTGGWNGGGISGRHETVSGGAGGGGATDIRIVAASTTNLSVWNSTASLRTRIMVAGGGGGCGNRRSPDMSTHGDCEIGGCGGGLMGETGSSVDTQYGESSWLAPGGGQTKSDGSAGRHSSAVNAEDYWFGLGSFGYASQQSNGSSTKYPNGFNCHGCGAGGGWYGGVKGWGTGGGGGSSFISGHPGCDAVNTSTGAHLGASTKTVYNSKTYEFSGTEMIDGDGYSWTSASQTREYQSPTVPGLPKIGSETASKPGVPAKPVTTNHGYCRITSKVIE